jgi:hypothetical protein
LLTFQVNGANGGKSVIDLAPPDASDGDVAVWDLLAAGQPYSANVELRDGVVIFDERGKYRPGDTNGDGAITQEDGEQLLALVAAQPSAYQSQLHALAPLFMQQSSTDQAQAQVAGDSNGNGELDAGDGVRILQFSQQRRWPNHATALAVNPAVTVTLGFDTVTAAKGNVATSTLSGQNLADFAGGEFSIVYDPTSIEGVAAITSTAPGTILRFVDNQNGQVQVALATNTALNGNQALFQIGFKLRPNAPSNYRDLLVLAAAQLYDHTGYDLLRGPAGPQLARTSGAVVVEKSANSLYLPTILR